jgi:DNA-binding XRE family transcriptional regulator
MLIREEILQRNCTPIEDLIAEDFGQPGTPERDVFDLECDAFILGERLKEERIKAGFTQEQFAQKAGVNKSTVSKIERGFADVKLSSLAKILSSIGLTLNLSLSQRTPSYGYA